MIIATICICNININASSYLKINDISDNVSVNSEQMELLSKSKSDDNNSYMSLYENKSEQVNYGYIKLPVQQNNININNMFNLSSNNFNKSSNIDTTCNIIKQNLQMKEKNNKSLCYYFTNTIKGIITIPVLLGSYAVSMSKFGTDNYKSSNIAISNLQNGSKEVMWISFDNTIKNFQNTTSTVWNYVTSINSNVITFGSNIFGNAKSWLLNRISN